MAKRGIGFSVADLLDLAMFNGLSESSEKDADRKPESAAAAAGHLVSSSSAAAHIPGAILYNSLCCELVQAINYVLGKWQQFWTPSFIC